MLVLITYDVSTNSAAGRRRLRKVAKLCCDYGQRVQNSVFECDVDHAQYVMLKHELLDRYDPNEDSIRIYNLGNRYAGRIEHFGIKEGYDPEGLLML